MKTTNAEHRATPTKRSLQQELQAVTITPHGNEFSFTGSFNTTAIINGAQKSVKINITNLPLGKLTQLLNNTKPLQPLTAQPQFQQPPQHIRSASELPSQAFQRPINCHPRRTVSQPNTIKQDCKDFNGFASVATEYFITKDRVRNMSSNNTRSGR